MLVLIHIDVTLGLSLQLRWWKFVLSECCFCVAVLKYILNCEHFKTVVGLISCSVVNLLRLC